MKLSLGVPTDPKWYPTSLSNAGVALRAGVSKGGRVGQGVPGGFECTQLSPGRPMPYRRFLQHYQQTLSFSLPSPRVAETLGAAPTCCSHLETSGGRQWAVQGHQRGTWSRRNRPRPGSWVPRFPPPGLSLKLEEKSHTTGTEPRTETQVGSALCTDTVFKENSLGKA